MSSVLGVFANRLWVGSKITQVFPIDEKETRCCGILSAKCPVFKVLQGRLKISQVFPINEKETRRCHVLFAKCPAFWTFSNKLSEVIFERSPCGQIMPSYFCTIPELRIFHLIKVD
jgi:hypothetical protein